MITPFSVLDTRTKEWKKRKEHWITTYGIQSELGREDIESKSQFWESTSNVSIFDPVLCELMYDWFVPKGGKILDPFAGGSVRGIVAEEMGYKYDGIELSQNQIRANQKQSNKPNWILGDSDKKLFLLEQEYDFVWTCPPYYDLEVYSDDKDDLSNMSEGSFDDKLDKIISENNHLKFLDSKNDPFMRSSRFFKALFTETGERTNRKLTFENFSGATLLQEDDSLGLTNMELDRSSKVMVDIYLSFLGKSEVVRMADKTISMHMGMDMEQTFNAELILALKNNPTTDPTMYNELKEYLAPLWNDKQELCLSADRLRIIRDNILYLHPLLTKITKKEV